LPYKYLIILPTLLLFSGCIPKIQTTIPAVEGQIVDAKTNQPITYVKIGNSKHKVKSDQNGHFTLKGEKELVIATVMGGLWRIKHSFFISKQGYYPLFCECDVLNTRSGCYNLTIPLTKIGNNTVKSYHEDGLTCFVTPTVK
jgi:hypothetical protein